MHPKGKPYTQMQTNRLWLAKKSQVKKKVQKKTTFIFSGRPTA